MSGFMSLITFAFTIINFFLRVCLLNEWTSFSNAHIMNNCNDFWAIESRIFFLLSPVYSIQHVRNVREIDFFILFFSDFDKIFFYIEISFWPLVLVPDFCLIEKVRTFLQYIETWKFLTCLFSFCQWVTSFACLFLFYWMECYTLYIILSLNSEHWALSSAAIDFVENTFGIENSSVCRLKPAMNFLAFVKGENEKPKYVHRLRVGNR